MGQTIPANEKIDPKSCYIGRNTVTNTIIDISNLYRQNSMVEMNYSRISYVGDITVDDVHLKVQGRHYDEFTINFLDIFNKRLFDGIKSQLRNWI